MDTIHQICCECRKLTLERISNASTCQLKIRADYPEKEQDHWELALGLKTPISFNLGHLRSSYLDCRICALLYQQLDTTLFTHHDILEGYLSKDLDGKLQNLWFYVQGSMERVALLDLYQVEGQLISTIESHWIDLCRNENRISKCPPIVTSPYRRTWFGQIDHKNPRVD